MEIFDVTSSTDHNVNIKIIDIAYGKYETLFDDVLFNMPSEFWTYEIMGIKVKDNSLIFEIANGELNER